MVRSKPQLAQVQSNGCLATFSLPDRRFPGLFRPGVIFLRFKNRSVQS